MSKRALGLTLLLFILLSACASPQPTGRIAFSSDRDGNAEIYLINADGTGLERLTFSSSADTSPAWSPDGQHIAYNQEFEGNLDVCVKHTDGPPINLTGWPGIVGGAPPRTGRKCVPGRGPVFRVRNR